MKCSKCKGEIKKEKTEYGYRYICPCKYVCIDTTANVSLINSENGYNVS
jgi:hypothetical protein